MLRQISTDLELLLNVDGTSRVLHHTEVFKEEYDVR